MHGITGMMGDVRGVAAFLCKLHGTALRGFYDTHLIAPKVLMQSNVGQKNLGEQQGHANF